MFLYIAQLIHEDNNATVKLLSSILNFFGITYLPALSKIITQVVISYLKTLPTWALLTVILVAREVHTNQTTKQASNLNNVVKKNQ